MGNAIRPSSKRSAEVIAGSGVLPVTSCLSREADHLVRCSSGAAGKALVRHRGSKQFPVLVKIKAKCGPGGVAQ